MSHRVTEPRGINRKSWSPAPKVLALAKAKGTIRARTKTSLQPGPMRGPDDCIEIVANRGYPTTAGLGTGRPVGPGQTDAARLWRAAKDGPATLEQGAPGPHPANHGFDSRDLPETCGPKTRTLAEQCAF